MFATTFIITKFSVEKWIKTTVFLSYRHNNKSDLSRLCGSDQFYMTELYTAAVVIVVVFSACVVLWKLKQMGDLRRARHTKHTTTKIWDKFSRCLFYYCCSRTTLYFSCVKYWIIRARRNTGSSLYFNPSLREVGTRNGPGLDIS